MACGGLGGLGFWHKLGLSSGFLLVDLFRLTAPGYPLPE